MNNQDEEKHVEGNIAAVEDIRSDLTTAENIELDNHIYELTRRYVEAEHTFIDLVFEMGPQEGMTKEELKAYIMYLANIRLESLGLNTIYDIKENPLEWMSWMLSGRKHNNFFETKMAAYDHTGLIGDIDYSQYKLAISE